MPCLFQTLVIKAFHLLLSLVITSQANVRIHVFDTLPSSASLSLNFSCEYSIFCAFSSHYVTNKLKLSFLMLFRRVLFTPALSSTSSFLQNHISAVCSPWFCSKNTLMTKNAKYHNITPASMIRRARIQGVFFLPCTMYPISLPGQK